MPHTERIKNHALDMALVLYLSSPNFQDVDIHTRSRDFLVRLVERIETHLSTPRKFRDKDLAPFRNEDLQSLSAQLSEEITTRPEGPEDEEDSH